MVLKKIIPALVQLKSIEQVLYQTRNQEHDTLSDKTVTLSQI